MPIEKTDRKTRFHIFWSTPRDHTEAAISYEGVDLKIVRRELGNITVLDIVGSIDLYNARELRSALQKVIIGGSSCILLNLRDLPTMDSTGVAVLLDTKRQLRKRNGDLRLLHVSEEIRELFRVTRLTFFFDVFEDETAAIAAFDEAEAALRSPGVV